MVIKTGQLEDLTMGSKGMIFFVVFNEVCSKNHVLSNKNEHKISKG